MRRWGRSVVLVWLLALALASPVRAWERISAFSTTVHLREDSSLRIEETITYETDEYHHGIFRYLPLRYRFGQNWITTPVRMRSITDENGQPYKYDRSTENNSLYVKIGDPEHTFTGSKTYVLTYEVANAVLWEDGGATRLVWDLVGEGWDFPVENMVARIESPVALTTVRCYSGHYGEMGNCTPDVHNRSITIQAARLDPGENVTAELLLEQPNALRPAPWWVRYRPHWEKFFGTELALLPVLAMGWWWWHSGRDWQFVSWNVFHHDTSRPQQRAPFLSLRQAPMVYEPLSLCSPGEAGALVHDGARPLDVVAEIVELARRQYLTIERKEKKHLWGSADDYVFQQDKPADDYLTEAQHYLHEKLFAGRTSVALSTLRGSFAPTIETAKKKIESSLVVKGYFAARPSDRKGWAIVVAVLLSIVAIGAAVHLANRYQWLYAFPLAVISAGCGFAFAFVMPAKSAVGSSVAWQARGLRESIRRGLWREKIHEKHLYFGETLPFAVALGVVQELARDMAALHVTPPAYFAGVGAAQFQSGFVSSFVSSATSTMSYSPSSSHGGGGFSGGGGGGGGGGSW